MIVADRVQALRGDLKEVDLLASRQRQRTRARSSPGWPTRCVLPNLDAKIITRTAREAAERLATEQQRGQEIAERDLLLEARIRDSRSEINGFKDSDAYREGSRLLELRGQIEQRRAEVRAAENSLVRATTRGE